MWQSVADGVRSLRPLTPLFEDQHDLKSRCFPRHNTNPDRTLEQQPRKKAAVLRPPKLARNHPENHKYVAGFGRRWQRLADGVRFWQLVAVGDSGPTIVESASQALLTSRSNRFCCLFITDFSTPTKTTGHAHRPQSDQEAWPVVRVHNQLFQQRLLNPFPVHRSRGY